MSIIYFVTLWTSPCLCLPIGVNHRNLIVLFPIPPPRSCRSKIKTVPGNNHSLFGISPVRRNRHNCYLVSIISIIPCLEINMPIIPNCKSTNYLRIRNQMAHYQKNKNRHQTFHNYHPNSVSGTTSKFKYS